MINEKAMVADALAGMNSELKDIGGIIIETENPQLKQIFKQMRNQGEMSQEELYKIAKERSYYVPAAKATQEEVQQVKSIFNPNPSML